MHWLSVAGLTFAGLFPLVNPFAALPLFASLTQGTPADWRKRTVIKTAIFVFVILVVTEYAGSTLLSFFGLSLGMLQIAGGLIVGHTAWMMSTDTPKITQEQEHQIKRSVGKALKDATVHAVTAAVDTAREHGEPNHRRRHDEVRHGGNQHGETEHAGNQHGETHKHPHKAGPHPTAKTIAASAESVAAAASARANAEPETERAPGSDHGTKAAALAASTPGSSAAEHAADTAPAAEHAKSPEHAANQPAHGDRPARPLPDISFSPMAMPMLAGPGSMGVVIGIVAHNQGAMDSVGIMIGIAGIALLALIVLAAATPLNRALGSSGILVMQRVFGFITLGIAVALVATGISSLFGIPIVN